MMRNELIYPLTKFATPYGSYSYGCQTYNQSGQCVTQTTPTSDTGNGLADTGYIFIIPIAIAIIIITIGALLLIGRKKCPRK